jgi:hypothetical protein
MTETTNEATRPHIGYEGLRAGEAVPESNSLRAGDADFCSFSA